MMIQWMFGNGRVGETLATFGDARVVRLGGGVIEIRGGNPRDLGEAREWASLFCHEALPAATRPRPAFGTRWQG